MVNSIVETRIQKVTVQLGGIEVDVFVMPDGTRYVSQTSLGKSIKKGNDSAIRFLAGNSPEALPYKDLSAMQVRYGKHKTLVSLLPMVVAGGYWSYWSAKGNPEANAILVAIAYEALDRRVDTALGTQKTEQEYEQQTKEIREWVVAKLTEANVNILLAHKGSIEELRAAKAEYYALEANLNPSFDELCVKSERLAEYVNNNTNHYRLNFN